MMRRFHYKDFSDCRKLVGLKGPQRICLAIPTLNEAATIGSIVETARRELMEDHPLLDEIIVIDSGSVDATGRIARDAGASVFQSADVAP